MRQNLLASDVDQLQLSWCLQFEKPVVPAPKTTVSGHHAWFLEQVLAENFACYLESTVWICIILCFSVRKRNKNAQISNSPSSYRRLWYLPALVNW